MSNYTLARARGCSGVRVRAADFRRSTAEEQQERLEVQSWSATAPPWTPPVTTACSPPSARGNKYPSFLTFLRFKTTFKYIF